MKLWILCALALVSVTAAAYDRGVVTEFEGRVGTTTRAFTVEGPWVLAWRVGSDHPDALGFELSLVDDRTDDVWLLVRTKRLGNGIKLFHDGGRYRLRVSCNFAAWHLQIEEVSRAEADEMLSR